MTKEPWQSKSATQWREKAARHASREFGRVIPQLCLVALQGRYQYFSRPRFYACAYLTEHGLTRERVRDILGYANHTSVLNALRRAHGHDRKGRAARSEPLWTKEHFEKLVLADQQEAAGKAWRAA